MSSPMKTTTTTAATATAIDEIDAIAGSVTLKLAFKGDLRRVPLTPPLKMKRLHKILTKSYPSLPPSAERLVTYVDEDGDAVTIATDPELREAVRHVVQDMGKKTLRLMISAATKAGDTAPPAYAKSTAASDPSWRESKASPDTPLMHFVADVAIPDGTVLAPGTSFRKVWSVKNPGPSSWAPGVRLVHVDGATFTPHHMTDAFSPLARAVDAGATIEIGINLIAPRDPGKHTGFFRLCTPDGESFGHRLWADIVVASKERDAEQRPADPAAFFGELAHAFGGPEARDAARAAVDAFQPMLRAAAAQHQHPYRGPPHASAVHHGVQCDVSGQCPIIGMRYHKIGANYDLNEAEFAKLAPAEQTAFEQIVAPFARPIPIAAGYVHRPGRAPERASTSAQQRAHTRCRFVPRGFAPLRAMASVSAAAADATPSPKMKFVRDVTVEDGSAFAPGVVFTKVWEIKNSGAASWPEGVVLAHVGGRDLGVVPADAVAVPPLNVGEKCDVAVEMCAPLAEGRARGDWRLKTADGTGFGNKLWIDVTVATTMATDEDTERALVTAVADAAFQECGGESADDRQSAYDRVMKATTELEALAIFGDLKSVAELTAATLVPTETTPIAIAVAVDDDAAVDVPIASAAAATKTESDSDQMKAALSKLAELGFEVDASQREEVKAIILACQGNLRMVIEHLLQ